MKYSKELEANLAKLAPAEITRALAVAIYGTMPSMEGSSTSATAQRYQINKSGQFPILLTPAEVSLGTQRLSERYLSNPRCAEFYKRFTDEDWEKVVQSAPVTCLDSAEDHGAAPPFRKNRAPRRFVAFPVR